MCLIKATRDPLEMPRSYSAMENGQTPQHVQQQQQIAEIFAILASLTRDMDSVKNTLEQLVGDGQNSNSRSRSRSGRASSWAEESRNSCETGLDGESVDRSAALPGLLLSPRMLDPIHIRHSPTQTVSLNIGGVRFETIWGVLERLPHTKLGRLAQSRGTQQALKLADRYDPLITEYYFDRRPRFFPDILGLYQTGKLHMSAEGCRIAFMEEMIFWDIDEMLLETCCHQKYLIEREQLEYAEEEGEDELLECFLPGRLGEIQKTVWDLFEKPTSSWPAKFIAMFSIFCIFVSTIILTLDTLPYFQDIQNLGHGYQPFVIIEACYMAWFTFEFFVRFVVSPNKVAFLKKFMNIIDLLAILPYFLSLGLHSYVDSLNLDIRTKLLVTNSTGVMLPSGGEGAEEKTTQRNMSKDEEVRRIGQFFRLLRIVKMFRVIRIFKLARHSGALKALGRTLKNCYRELGMLFLFLFMGVLIFSSLVYVFENDAPDTSFLTMLDSYWWALVTMTTVGYGDVYPITGIGRIVGGICATFGVLVIALPIPIIGNQFGRYYQREQRLTKLQERLGAGYAGKTVKPVFTAGVLLTKWSNKTSNGNGMKISSKYK